MKFFIIINRRKWNRGFVLPLTLVICMIVLIISSGISIILAKELYFSRLSRLSQIAYYAADDGMMCALMMDDNYIDPDTGLGIFQSGASPTAQEVLDKVNARRLNNLLPVITLSSIKCATSEVFTAGSNYQVSQPSGQTDSVGNQIYSTTFDMNMDLGDGTRRCAQITVNKTPKYRQIISRGFASCTLSSTFRIERAIVSTAETQ